MEAEGNRQEIQGIQSATKRVESTDGHSHETNWCPIFYLIQKCVYCKSCLVNKHTLNSDILQRVFLYKLYLASNK